MTGDDRVLEELTRGLEEFGRRVHAVGGPDDRAWSNPTPCAEWDVRTLVNHLVGELRWIPPLLDGRTIADVGDELDGDLLGDDPQRAWDEAVTAATTAAGAPGVLERTVHLSYGDRPAAGYLAEVTSDLTVHSWDLARGIGADDTVDPELVRVTYARMEPAADVLAASGVFGPPVEVGDDADLQTRLLALVGRRR